MKIRYDKLWQLMKNNKLKKSDLSVAAEISSYTMSKLYRNEPVSLEVIMRLCKVFHCDVGDIVEIIEDAVNQVQVLAKEHDLTISIMKEPDLPEIYLNVDSISRAFMNILSNAIKYSPDGKRIKIR
jgi:DNA-binding Xre family transcriptional regulator